MRKNISHVPHVLPWDLGMIRNNFFGHMSSSFTDNFKIPHYGVKGLGVGPELFKIQVSSVLYDPFDGCQNVSYS